MASKFPLDRVKIEHSDSDRAIDNNKIISILFVGRATRLPKIVGSISKFVLQQCRSGCEEMQIRCGINKICFIVVSR